MYVLEFRQQNSPPYAIQWHHGLIFSLSLPLGPCCCYSNATRIRDLSSLAFFFFGRKDCNVDSMSSGPAHPKWGLEKWWAYIVHGPHPIFVQCNSELQQMELDPDFPGRVRKPTYQKSTNIDGRAIKWMTGPWSWFLKYIPTLWTPLFNLHIGGTSNAHQHGTCDVRPLK